MNGAVGQKAHHLNDDTQNPEIKSEIVTIDIDDQIFMNDGYFDDDSQELQSVSCSPNIDAEDENQLLIKEEIICKEEPVFYDAIKAQFISVSQMMLALTEEDQENDSVRPTATVHKQSLRRRPMDRTNVDSTAATHTATIRNERKTRGKTRRYECYICKYSVRTIHLLRSHVAQHIGIAAYKCRHCAATFKSKWYYVRHCSQAHSRTGQKSTCPYCHRMFDTQARLANHERIHTGQKPFECSTCGKRFNAKTSIQWHMKIHTDEKPFECNLCEMRFRLKHHLNSHLATHAIRTIHEQQSVSINAKAHGRYGIEHGSPSMDPVYSHSIDVRTYRCYLCDFNGNRNQLKMHMKTVHTGEPLFQCTICKKNFLQAHSIDLHMLTHSTHGQYKCDICGKQFIRKDFLKIHMQARHTQKTEFQCKICTKKFYKKFTFVTHIRTHTGFKPWPCTFCGKTFVKRSDMVRHTRTHTGERPYQCKMCKMTFTRNHLLSDHNRNIHGL